MRSLKYLKGTRNTPKEIVFREKNFKIIIRSAWPDDINEKNCTKMLNYTREKPEKYFFWKCIKRNTTELYFLRYSQIIKYYTGREVFFLRG